MPDLQMDFVANGRAIGDVAQFIMMNGQLNIGAKRPFIDEKTGKGYISVYKGGDPKRKESWITVNATATLRRDEWKQLDQALIEVSRQRLGGFQDIVDAGLVYPIGNAMGTTVLEWHDVSDAGEAVMTMDGLTRGNNDRPVYQYNYLPIPIIHVDYEINARELATSRNLGNALDTTMVERGGRKIAEKLEDLLFSDTAASLSYGTTDSRGRNSIYSFLSFPDRVQVTFASVPGNHWDDSATTAESIVKCVNKLKQYSIDNYHYGPWHLYIPVAYETRIDEDYDTTAPTGTTIRERIMKIDGIKKIKVIDRLPADNVLLVQMTSDVVRIVRGMGLTNLEWAVEGGMLIKHKIMTIQVPQIRSDQNGKCGIVHLAG